jgi:PAS domain S-box-containing protein
LGEHAAGMTTSKKLWVGFGALIALLVLVSTAIVIRLYRAERVILAQADVSRPRAAAAREMEVGVLRFALTLRIFAQTRDPRQRDLAVENIAAVEKNLSEYLRHAATDRQRELGARFTSHWTEYRELADVLLDFPARQLTPEQFQRMLAIRPVIEDLLDREMQPDAVAAFEARKEEAYQGVRDVVAFALLLLTAGVVLAVLTSWTVGRGVVKAERRALADAERLRLAVEATSIGVWQVDYRADRIIWSDRCREIFGLPSHGELTRSMVLERIHPDDRDEVVRATEESMGGAEGGRFTVEHRVVTPSGEVRWVASRGRTQFDGANGSRTPMLHTGVMVDVTERKRVEEEIRQSEARFRRLADAMPQIVYVTAFDGRIEFVNQRWTEYAGIATADAEDVESIIHPDDLPAVRAHWDAARTAGEGFSAELRLRRAADGAYRWFLTRTVPIRDADGRVVRWYGTSTDIHERKQAEEAFRTSEERYKAFIANSSEGIWRLELDPPIDVSLPVEEQVELAYLNGRYAECNDAMARMYGLERAEDLVGRTIDFMLPYGNPAAREFVASLVRLGYRAVDVESEERDASGDAVHFVNSMVGVVEDGLLKRVWGTQRDATERKRHEARIAELNADLRRRVEELQTLLDALPVGVFTASDPECRDITMNKAGADLLRLDRETNASLTGAEGNRLAFRLFKDGAEVPADDLPMQRAARTATGVTGEEYELAFADGERRHLFEYASPLFDESGKVRGCLGVFVDITATKRAEAALRESEERFRTLADNISQLAWMADENGWIFWYNKRWHEYTGTTPESQEGWGWQSVHHPDALPEVVDRWRRALATHEPFDMVFPLKGADGVFRPFLTRAMPVKDEAGRVVRWLGTNTDVTEQRALEEALKEADRRKDEFLATLAHELRNPLAPIRNGLQILKMAGADAGAAEKARTMMDRQLAQMVRLIDDLLDVSRISRGKIELKRKYVDLAAVVQTAVETSRPLIDAAGHELVVSLPSSPVVVDADATRLAQIFANLLNNAAKFTDRGGRIELTLKSQGDDAVVLVNDSGEGIPPAMLSRVFEMFTQVDRTLERPHGGLGIGLTLVKSLVEMHGGSVEARSAGPGQGSEFEVRLPAVPDAYPVGDSAIDEPEPPRPPTPRRILIADDNADSAASLAEMLRLMGHHVRTASDGQEAIDAADSFRPEIVLLDIGMPKLNGYDACRRLRERSWVKNAVVVALTGWGQDDDRRRSKEAGFDRHLVKPVAARTLTKFLAELEAGRA